MENWIFYSTDNIMVFTDIQTNSRVLCVRGMMKHTPLSTAAGELFLSTTTRILHHDNELEHNKTMNIIREFIHVTVSSYSLH